MKGIYTMSITVYSKPVCPQCDATKKYLTKMDVEYTEIDISQDEAARQEVLDMGYQQTPVVKSGDVHFSGFRIDKLREIATV